MATDSTPLQLAERTDVHKSCKSFETLLNVLNDYCEAAGAIVLLQKKLAKALRETAGLKTTREIAANAMNASAAIFEASSDIDSKFAKIVDKEYDGISAEVKRWFKKLTKEEKAHDERMFNANAKIKQAGQIYEKKSKKNPRDAADEHARYINLISALGPEISQEKYNHALNVTQRHTSTTYSAAACLSRIADSEWVRAYEGVRRFAPTIGQLGEWRALCEGGWTGSLPQDLPDPEESQQTQPDRDIIDERRIEEEDRQAPTTLRNVEVREPRESTERARPPPGYTLGPEQARDSVPLTRNSPTLLKSNLMQTVPSGQEQSLSTGPSSFEPPRPFVDPNTGSVRSLSAFPSPPTHFPLPPPRRQQPSQLQSSQSSSYTNFSTLPRLTESPLPGDEGEGVEDSIVSFQPNHENLINSDSAPPSPEEKFQETSARPDTLTSSTAYDDDHQRPVPIRSQTMPPAVSATNNNPVDSPDSRVSHNRDEYRDQGGIHEFGMNVGHPSKNRTMDPAKTQAVERSDTSGSSGSIVADMRNRYSNTSGATSPILKDIPRLPLSVGDLATRYQSADGPSSPRARTSSVPQQLPLTPVNAAMQGRPPTSYQERTAHGDHKLSSTPPTTSVTPTTPTPGDEASRRRQQRISDLAALELKEKQLQELQERERDIAMRAQELERDKARLMNVRPRDDFAGSSDGLQSATSSQPQMQLRPRERKTSFRQQRPQSQLDSVHQSPPSPNMTRPQSQYSYSTNHLVPPSPSSVHPSYSHDGQSSSNNQSPTSSRQSTQYQDDQAHAPYCGCETCSVAKYKLSQAAPHPVDLRPPAKPITLRPVEKSKPGWMRRLSMPVGNAFNLDSKKGIGNIASAGGTQGKGGIFSLDGKKTTSTTNLRAGIHEDGRRSYDASGNSNRSMTNLGRR